MTRRRRLLRQQIGGTGRLDRPNGAYRCFAARRRSGQSLYAVELTDHPGVVKVGRTVNWNDRRKAYEQFGMRNSGGIAREVVWTITEEWENLELLEREMLAALRYPRVKGLEYLRAELSDVTIQVRELLCAADVSFIEEASEEF